MSVRTRFNQKRRIASTVPARPELDELVRRVRYVGSPYHKRSPGDFGLSPPTQPRPDKTLCDDAGIKKVAQAQSWLEEGVRRGLLSADWQDGFPKHVWAVTDDGTVLEARYSNEGPGHYHGYPLFEPDPFRLVVLERWNRL